MYKENMNYENQQRMIFDIVNEFGIPEIQPTKYEPCEFIGFNQKDFVMMEMYGLMLGGR